MNPNSGLVEDDLERGEYGRYDGSHRTKLVRDMTYKIIPFCGSFLVVFSIGAILVSTLAFNKPIPHQGTLAVSIILLTFFVLFCVGFMYLYLRRFRLHASGNARQISWPPGSTKGISRTFRESLGHSVSHDDAANSAVIQGTNGGLFRSDNLRDPVPSPNTYNRQEREQREADRTQCELGTSVNQPARPPEQQQARDVGNGRGPRQEDAASMPRHYRTHLHHGAQASQKYHTGRLPRDVRAQSLSVEGNLHHAVPLRHTMKSTSQWPTTDGRQYQYEQRSRSKKPGVDTQELGSPFPTTPRPTMTRPPQVQSPGLGTQLGDAAAALPANTWTRNGEGQQYVSNDGSGPQPRVPPLGPRKMNVARDKVSAPSKVYNAKREPGRTAGSVDSQSSGPRNIGRIPDFQASIHQSMRQSNSQQDPGHNPNLPSTNVQTIPATFATSSLSHNNNAAATSHEGGPERSTQWRAFSYDITDSTEDIHQDTKKQNPTHQTPASFQTRGFVPRHPSAVPEPLRLVDKSKRKEKGKTRADAHTAQTPKDHREEVNPEIPTPTASRRPQSPISPYISRDGRGRSHNLAPQAVAPEQLQGQAGTSQAHIQVPQRGSNRKFKSSSIESQVLNAGSPQGVYGHRDR
ncbi:hypothetical protein GGS21DRAFT_490789 [Xylaria nigripes]|nr:hypothetical protein GGS21DRAFT_490789 [Xylaria nigripes]